MKKALGLFLLVFAICGSLRAQFPWVPMTAAGYDFKGVKADTLLFKTGCGAPTTTPGSYYHYSSAYYDTCGKGFWVYDPSTFLWTQIGSGDANFPIYVDTLFPIDDSTFRWCKGMVCHDINIKGGQFVFNCPGGTLLSPYRRDTAGYTTASNTPQYSQGQKGFFSNTDTLMSWYGNEHLRSYLQSSTGIQRWYLNNGMSEDGSVSISTPFSFPGIHFNDINGFSRSQIRLYSGGGLSFGSIDSLTTGIPPTQMLFRNNGKVIITGRVGDYSSGGEPYIVDSSQQGLFNAYGSIRSTDLIGTGNRNVAADANGKLVIDNTVGSGGSGGIPWLSSIARAIASNTISNGDFPQEWKWDSLSSNSAFKLSSASIRATGNTQTLLNVAMSGANSNANQTTLGMQVANSHTGTNSVNIGGYFSANGATTNYAIQTGAGAIDAQINGIGNTSTDGFIIQNTTAATSSTHSYSPRIHLGGYEWKTNIPSASQPIDGYISMQGVQAAANPIADLVMGSYTNGFTNGATFDIGSSGVMTMTTAGAPTTLYVNGGIGIGQVASLSTGQQTTSALTLGSQIGNTLTSLISTTASLTNTINTTIGGIIMTPQIGTGGPHPSSQWFGGNFAIQASRSDFTTLPSIVAGVKGSVLWGSTGTSIDLPLAYGAWGNINLNNSVTKNITVGYGLYSSLTSPVTTPTGKVGTYVGLMIDSASANFFNTAAWGVRQINNAAKTMVNHLESNVELINANAPSASVTHGIILFAQDVSSSSELKVRDEAGNVTVLSPHDFDHVKKSNNMAWSYTSQNEKYNAWIQVDMYKAIRTIETQSAEIEDLKKDIAELKGMIYHKKRPVKLIYTGKLKK